MLYLAVIYAYMQVLIYHNTTEWIPLKITVTCFGGTPPSSGRFSAATCNSKLRNLFLCMLDVHLLVLYIRCLVTVNGMRSIKIVQRRVQKKLPLITFLIHMTPLYVHLCLGLPKWLFLQGFQWELHASSSHHFSTKHYRLHTFTWLWPVTGVRFPKKTLLLQSALQTLVGFWPAQLSLSLLSRKVLQSAVASSTSNPQPGGPVIRTF